MADYLSRAPLGGIPKGSQILEKLARANQLNGERSTPIPRCFSLSTPHLSIDELALALGFTGGGMPGPAGLSRLIQDAGFEIGTNALGSEVVAITDWEAFLESAKVRVGPTRRRY